MLNAYSGATGITTKLQRHTRLVIFRYCISPPDTSVSHRITHCDSIVMFTNCILKIIDRVEYRGVISSFLVPRIPQNKRGEASNRSMKTKHKTNVMDVKSFFPGKLAEIVAIPFDKLSQIKAISTYTAVAIPWIIAKSLDTWLRAANTKDHESNSAPRPRDIGRPIFKHLRRNFCQVYDFWPC
jgi:hypothetical protein